MAQSQQYIVDLFVTLPTLPPSFPLYHPPSTLPPSFHSVYNAIDVYVVICQLDGSVTTVYCRSVCNSSHSTTVLPLYHPPSTLPPSFHSVYNAIDVYVVICQLDGSVTTVYCRSVCNSSHSTTVLPLYHPSSTLPTPTTLFIMLLMCML